MFIGLIVCICIHIRNEIHTQQQQQQLLHRGVQMRMYTELLNHYECTRENICLCSFAQVDSATAFVNVMCCYVSFILYLYIYTNVCTYVYKDKYNLYFPPHLSCVRCVARINQNSLASGLPRARCRRKLNFFEKDVWGGAELLWLRRVLCEYLNCYGIIIAIVVIFLYSAIFFKIKRNIY